VIRGRWQDKEVKSSLDLCLSCKGCKSDCPVAVDVATYKAEFLSHHYQRKLRPLRHYAFGQIDRWARLASFDPSFANFLTQTSVLAGLAKSLAGIAPQRSIPAFAHHNFRAWFKHRDPNRIKTQGQPVILWPDTFNNYFHPETAVAAFEVLEAAGYQVQLPRAHVCCGRPLYDFGMLNRAKKLLQSTMTILEAEIAAGTPVVVLEPSCASVFRDELLNLFPDDARAQQLSQQVFLFSEFLEKCATEFPFPEMRGDALVHGHCHQKSIMRNDAAAVLRRLGLNSHAPAQGCCGMAGAFGFEEEKYQISIDIGELELLPAIRNASPDWLIIADGFSCREQITQCTGRKTLHLAEVIRMGMGDSRNL
jgi:Fe-S oxidoreductase